MLNCVKILFAMLALSASAGHATESSDGVARRLYESLTGVPLMSSDPRLRQMRQLVDQGDLKGAAAIATDDTNFYNVTLLNWASRMTGKEESPLAVFSDFQALLIGTVRDDLDARGMLSGDYLYHFAGNSPAVSLASNNHFAAADLMVTSLKDELVRRQPQWPNFPEAAGVFTTRGWGSVHYDGGTNRRSVEYAFREFMCAPISQWRDNGLPTDRIRRDVDRAPGGNPATFQSLCRTCHGAMDGMAGAFARLDFVDGALLHMGGGVAAKFNRNATVYPEGYQTIGDSWVNNATQNHNAAFGWRGPVSGIGPRAFGEMIGNSQGFKQCMVRRAFREVCRRDVAASDQEEVDRLSEQFEGDGFKLKSLFQNVAISPRCL